MPNDSDLRPMASDTGDLDLLSRIISDIYDNSGSIDAWPRMLEQVAKYIGGQGGHLFCIDPASGRTKIGTVSGYDPADAHIYHTEYAEVDVRIPAVISRPERIFCCQDITSQESWERSRFVNEFADPTGARWVIAAVFRKTPEALGMLSVMRPRKEGPFLVQHKRRFALLLQHLQRAFDIDARLGQIAEGYQDVASALDAFDIGILLVDDRGRLVFANANAETLIRDRHLTATSDRRLAIHNPLADARLEGAVRTAVAVRNGDPIPVSSSSFGVESRERTFVIHVLPLGRSHRLLDAARRAAAVVLVIDPKSQSVSQGRSLSGIFGFTHAETRLACDLMSGLQLNKIAELHRLSRETLRSQLRALFDKTGTRRQTELVRLLMSATTGRIRVE